MVNVNKQSSSVPLIHKRREETGSKLVYIADVSAEHDDTTLSLKVGKMRNFSLYTTSTKSVLREQRKNMEESCNIQPKIFSP